ncbi:MAG: hypothetical protein CM1200mP40_22540 [Gammaproteobacteria bacterium]|nr:MAG: hypothetical protein CM1200mP40_22540 [Gammaproteobacteria bacterium]
MSATLDLAKQLIERASNTPDDKDCQQILAERLTARDLPVSNILLAKFQIFGQKLEKTGHSSFLPAIPTWFHLDHWKNGLSTHLHPPKMVNFCMGEVLLI